MQICTNLHSQKYLGVLIDIFKSHLERICILGNSVTLQIPSKEFNLLLKRGALEVINMQSTVMEPQHVLPYLDQKAHLTLERTALYCLYGNAEVIPGSLVQR